MNTGSIISSLLPINKRWRYPLLAWFAVNVLLSAPLLPLQQQRAQSLYQLFVAPCCWRQSVAIHESPQALHVRSEIDEAVAAGKTDSEIKAALIHEYGHGILMNPEGARAIVAYAGPLLGILLGLFISLKWLRTHLASPRN